LLYLCEEDKRCIPYQYAQYFIEPEIVFLKENEAKVCKTYNEDMYCYYDWTGIVKYFTPEQFHAEWEELP